MKSKLLGAALLTLAPLLSCDPPAPGYAGTTTFGSPMLHASGSLPTIIVQDDADASWPVSLAVAGWGVPVKYGICRATVNCVHIISVSKLAPSGGVAEVGLTWQGNSPGEPAATLIELADNPKMNAWQKLEDVAHEFGHALGLGHDEIGVMHPAVSGAFTKPDAAELARLRHLYLS